jgi:hypothetical protein
MATQRRYRWEGLDDQALPARIVSLGLAYRPEWRLFES